MLDHHTPNYRNVPMSRHLKGTGRNQSTGQGRAVGHLQRLEISEKCVSQSLTK